MTVMNKESFNVVKEIVLKHSFENGVYVESEFISNLYEALKFLKIYNFDYVISVPNDRIAGYSGIYDLDKNEDIEIYFTKILGFENI